MKKFVQVKHLSELKTTDIIRHVNHEIGIMTCNYIVTGNYGLHVTAVDTIDVTNPPEWEVLREVGDEK